MSRVMDRVTVVRSMTHPYPIHGVAYAMTGVPAIDVAMELNPRDAAALAVLRLGASSTSTAQTRPRPSAGDAAEHRAAVPVQQPARRRGAAGRPVRGVPRQGVQPDLDRVRRPRRTRPVTKTLQDQTLDVPRAVRRLHARQPLPPRRRDQPAAGADARPARPPPVAAASSSTTAAASLDVARRAARSTSYQDMAYSLLGSPKVGAGARRAAGAACDARACTA